MDSAVSLTEEHESQMIVFHPNKLTSSSLYVTLLRIFIPIIFLIAILLVLKDTINGSDTIPSSLSQINFSLHLFPFLQRLIIYLVISLIVLYLLTTLGKHLYLNGGDVSQFNQYGSFIQSVPETFLLFSLFGDMLGFSFPFWYRIPLFLVVAWSMLVDYQIRRHLTIYLSLKSSVSTYYSTVQILPFCKLSVESELSATATGSYNYVILRRSQINEFPTRAEDFVRNQVSLTEFDTYVEHNSQDYFLLYFLSDTYDPNYYVKDQIISYLAGIFSSALSLQEFVGNLQLDLQYCPLRSEAHRYLNNKMIEEPEVY